MSGIFKELNPGLFEKNKGPGRPRIYTADIMLPFVQWRYLNKIIRCKDLENRWTRNDDTYNFILDYKKPGKSSINEFLNENDYLIDEFDIFIVDFSLKIFHAMHDTPIHKNQRRYIKLKII